LTGTSQCIRSRQIVERAKALLVESLQRIAQPTVLHVPTTKIFSPKLIIHFES